MNLRWKKELHPLLLPAVVALVSALVFSASSEDWLGSLSVIGFLVGTVTLAVLPFGSEFHERTMALVLAQPRERSHLWQEKHITAAAVFGIILAVGTAGLWNFGKLWKPEPLLALTVVFASFCSAGFWTLCARSIVGGIAFTTAIQCALAIGVQIFTDKIGTQAGSTLDLVGPGQVSFGAVFGVVEAIYGILFFWLGWRRLVKFEAKDGTPTDLAAPTSILTGERWWSNRLKSRPAGLSRNVLIKEFRLEQPVLMLSSLYVLLWLLMIVFQLLKPEWGFENLFMFCTLLYTVICSLLAGAVATGEENALGIAAWHQSLPLAKGSQWRMRLAVGLIMALVLAVALPSLLMAGTVAACPADSNFRPGPNEHVWKAIGWWMLGSAILYLFAFWAVSFLRNTIKAVLTAVLTIATLGALSTLAAYSAIHLGGLEVPLVSFFVRHAGSEDAFSHLGILGLVLLSLLAVTVLLYQSFSQFGRANIAPKTFARAGAILGLVIFLESFWCWDLGISLNKQRQFPASMRIIVPAAQHGSPSR